MAGKNQNPTAYDITSALARIENELIMSLIRNLEKHKTEETDEGFEWSAWQVEQLKALDEYKRRNRKKYGTQFQNINRQIELLIAYSRLKGGADQEIKILEAIRKGFSAQKVSDSMQAEFFKINDRKLDALIKATVSDMEEAETAVLRKSEDEYRRIIYDAQVYANTGAGTYEKAIDMATKDFLKHGIQSIVYKNGSKHTIEDYADMAIKTASKRAYLQGEGEMRQEWGISTVIVNKRGNPCPKCLPHTGKVYIDDVWSGGNKDGISETTGIKYPLISSAIEAGLFHPRCKDSHTTYFEGISTPPKGSVYTKEELDEIANNYSKSQKIKQAEHNAESYDRLAKYSLDEENKQIYKEKADSWKKTKAILKK